MNEHKPNFALGYHEKWEAWLHEYRALAVASGKPLTMKEEADAVCKWMTANHRTAAMVTPCNICQEQIAQAMLDGTDPFVCPESARQLLEQYGFRITRRLKSGSITR